MKTEKISAGRGRPRIFDIDEALDKALDLFRRQGYEGTSLSDLTEAMGINRPSLYAAFGNKEELFQKALDRYSDSADYFMNQCMSQPTARAAIEQFLYGVAQVHDDDAPRGCLLVRGALACSEDGAAIQQELLARRKANQAIICKRLERALDEGELPAGTNPEDLARYIATVQHGLSVQASSGATQEELINTVKIALRAWPT